MEIERCQENVKKLKADRTYKSKKDLERYNLLLKQFKKYRDCLCGEIPELSISTVKTLHKKRDSIIELVLDKLNLIHKKTRNFAMLSEEQLIEHEMLTTNTDFIFIDAETQVDQIKDVKSVMVNTLIEVVDRAVETDEYLEYMEVEESADSQEAELARPISIYITNEYQEEIAAFDNLINVSVFEFSDPQESLKPTFGTRKVKKNSAFRWRTQLEKTTQTDERIFEEVAKIQEEELIDWILNDRKEYLKGIQRQILHKKNELSRVGMLINRRSGESMVFDESKLQFSMSSCESTDDLLENEIAYLETVGILKNDAEIESWKHGYYYGYNQGRNQAFVSNEDFEETDLLNSMLSKESLIKDDERLRNESHKIIIRRSTLRVENPRLSRKSTKIQAFNFKHQEAKPVKKKNKKTRYIEKFNEESSRILVKQAKMSRKMTIKSVSSIYAAALIKRTSQELMNLSTFVYDEYCARFGQKLVVKKKLYDLLCSVIKYPDSRKLVNFAKLFGISGKIGLEDYSRPKQNFRFLIHLLELIQKSNLGIIVTLDENLDYQFIPAIRAIDCCKEILSPFCDSVKVQNIIGIIEKNSHPDPKKINKFGIVDQDFLQELLLIEYDEYLQNVSKGIWVLLEGLYFSENIERIYKLDFIMLVRYVSPGKFSSLFANGDIETLNKIVRSKEKKNTVSVTKVFDCCFENGLLSPKDIAQFFPYEVNEKEVKEHIVSTKESVKVLLWKMLANKNAPDFTQDYYLELESRYNNLVGDLDIEPKILFGAWTIFNLEMQRLG